MTPKRGLNRRHFIGTTGAIAGAATFGIRASGAQASETVRLALIGAGSRGNQLLDGFLPRPEVQFVAVADVDDAHAGQTAERIGKTKNTTAPDVVRDYRSLLERKDIDAVVIATPDHWHAIPTIHACQAGKDVYCEKPLAHNVKEGRAMVDAARKHERVVAIGTQQRSSENFQKAVEVVRSGALGKIFWVQTWNFENISPVGLGTQPDTAAPANVDYDKWLGPAPERPFNLNRFHLLFRWYFDYAGGMMSDWGVHLNDIALWALGHKGPKTVSTAGGVLTSEDDRDTPDTMQVVYTFPDDCMLTYSMRKGNGLQFLGRGYGILFCGTNGSLVLDRSGHEILPDKIDQPYGIRLVKGPRENRKIDLQPSTFKASGDGTNEHIANFLDCLKTRERPTTDVEINHFSTNTCHLGNIAYLTKRTLTWDAETETFPGDDEANALLGRTYRKGYELPTV
jgi:predicted dehydrogenase